jgi:hypothetical protein
MLHADPGDAMGDREGGEGATERGGWGSQGGEEDGGKAAGTPLLVGLGLSKTFLYCDGSRQAGEGASMPSGVNDLDEFKKWGKSRNWCP